MGVQLTVTLVAPGSDEEESSFLGSVVRGLVTHGLSCIGTIPKTTYLHIYVLLKK